MRQPTTKPVFSFLEYCPSVETVVDIQIAYSRCGSTEKTTKPKPQSKGSLISPTQTSCIRIRKKIPTNKLHHHRFLIKFDSPPKTGPYFKIPWNCRRMLSAPGPVASRVNPSKRMRLQRRRVFWKTGIPGSHGTKRFWGRVLFLVIGGA